MLFNKLRISEAAAYLQHGVNYILDDDLYNLYEMSNIEVYNYKDSVYRIDDHYSFTVKLVLHPIKDIFNIEFAELREYITEDHLENMLSFVPPMLVSGNNLSYAEFDALCMYHFDCFNLIKRGLAIDINSLNKLEPQPFESFIQDFVHNRKTIPDAWKQLKDYPEPPDAYEVEGTFDEWDNYRDCLYNFIKKQLIG